MDNEQRVEGNGLGFIPGRVITSLRLHQAGTVICWFWPSTAFQDPIPEVLFFADAQRPWWGLGLTPDFPTPFQNKTQGREKPSWPTTTSAPCRYSWSFCLRTLKAALYISKGACLKTHSVLLVSRRKSRKHPHAEMQHKAKDACGFPAEQRVSSLLKTVVMQYPTVP